MRTARNDGVAPVTLRWCVRRSHHESGMHHGPLQQACAIHQYVIAPGGRLSYDDRAANGLAIAAAAQGAGMSEEP
jgi:hypothetical protein